MQKVRVSADCLVSSLPIHGILVPIIVKVLLGLLNWATNPVCELNPYGVTANFQHTTLRLENLRKEPRDFSTRTCRLRVNCLNYTECDAGGTHQELI